jgi:hypothetical protein
MSETIQGDKQLEIELVAITSDAEKVIEQAGRTCYLSLDKIGAGSDRDFIKRLIKMKITIFFEIESLAISKKMKHYGPPVWIDKENFDAFVKKWKQVYADNVNIVSDAERKDVDIKKIVLCVLEKELENV